MMGFASLYPSYKLRFVRARKRRARRREPASSRLLQQDQCRPPNAQISTRIGIGTPSSHSNMYRPISHLLSEMMRT
jgi:hypothetical protein